MTLVTTCLVASVPNISVVASAASSAPAVPAAAMTAASTAQKLDRVIRDTFKATGAPGVIVGLSMRGLPNYVRTLGVADTRDCAPMRPDLFMRMGSETKTFTVTALLRLVDRGVVRLDDPISRYVAGVPNGWHITLRDLADMRSGLVPYTDDPGFEQQLLADPYRQWTPHELLSFAFKHHNRPFKPGTEFEYSNTNTILLGLVVEKETRLPLEVAMRDLVTGPSHLDDTLFPVGAEIPRPHAHGYTEQTPTLQEADATHWNPSWGWAAGAMISNLRDLRSWAVNVATGRLLKPATQAERLAALPTGAPGDAYGLGIDINHGWIGHAGSQPGYQSLTIYLPGLRASLVILVNSDVPANGERPAVLLGRAITQVISPGNVYADASDQS